MAQQILNTSTPNDGLGDPLRIAFNKQQEMNTELYGDKVDKVSGKQLSKNDFTDILKQKLEGIEAFAEVNIQADALQTNPLAKDFIKNFPAIPNFQDYALVLEPILFISDGTTNNITLPANFKAKNVLLNKAPLYKVSEWTQSGSVLTITNNLVNLDEIYITN